MFRIMWSFVDKGYYTLCLTPLKTATKIMFAGSIENDIPYQYLVLNICLKIYRTSNNTFRYTATCWSLSKKQAVKNVSCFVVSEAMVSM